MGLFELLWEYHQHKRIQQAETTAAIGKERVEAVRTDFGRLCKQLSRQALVCQALWELLSERLGVTEEELAAKIEEIDLRDGLADGKIGTQQLRCPQCGRPSNSSRRTCLYCGADLDVPHAFG